MAITRLLACNLNEEDILARGKSLANAERHMVDVEQQKADANRNFKKTMDAVQERITYLADAIHNRSEIRDVECAIRENFANMTKELYRLDTGDVVEKYDMTDAERQGSLL